MSKNKDNKTENNKKLEKSPIHILKDCGYCSKCNRILPLDKWYSTTENGSENNSKCKECINRINQERKETLLSVKAGEMISHMRPDYKKICKEQGVEYVESDLIKVNAEDLQNLFFAQRDSLRQVRCAYSGKVLCVLDKLCMLDEDITITCINPKIRYCGSLDHIKNKGGLGVTELGNILMVDKGLNSSKGYKDIDTWYKEQPYFDETVCELIKEYMETKSLDTVKKITKYWENENKQ